jgi:hypothetical protein
MTEYDRMHEADIWPLPHRSWLRRIASRLAAWVGYVLYYVVGVVLQSPGLPLGVDAPSRSLKKRVRRLREGGSDSTEARVIGNSAWCPTLPDHNVITLGWRNAVSKLGRERVIPIDDLAPIAIHRPRTKPGLESLPRRYWVLDLDGSGRHGSIAATIEDLALLGAAAGWDTPPRLGEIANSH